MSIVQRDYILRMIEQFSEALARILGLKKAGKLDEARRLVQQTADSIFGPMRAMLDHVDPAGAAALCGSAEKLDIYATLTAEEADLADASGDHRKARTGHRRALELYLESSRMAPAKDARRAAIEVLLGKVDPHRLDKRYRDLLAKLGI